MNKTGPHVLEVTLPAFAWSRAAPIVKVVNRFGSFDQSCIDVLQAAPDYAIRVFRVYVPDQDLTRMTPARFVDIVLACLGSYRHPRLYVELLNETYQYQGKGLEEYVAWTKLAVALLHGHGLKVAGFGFSTGCPEPADWLYLKAQGFGGVDAISMHEYWGGQGFSTWNALRYRRVREWLGFGSQAYSPDQHPPFLITEAGRDRVEGGQGGWALDGVSADQYIQEIVDYNTLIARDPYVLGAVIFTAGPTPDWAHFSTDAISAEIVRRLPPPAAIPIPVAPTEKPMQTIKIGDVDVYDARHLTPYYGNRAYETRGNAAITTVVQHHTVTGNPKTIEEAVACIKAMHDRHTQTLGWPAIGYHFAIDGEGRIYQTNGIELISYHCKLGNTYSIGVAWMGTFTRTDTPPPKVMVDAAARLYRGLQKHLGKDLRLLGHYEVPSNEGTTTCPGYHWPQTKQTMIAQPSSTSTAAPPQFRLGPGFAQYLKDHPDVGAPRQDEWYDTFGNAYLWLTASPKHRNGAQLIWRKWLNRIELIPWD